MFKNRPSKICGRQPLKNLKEHGLFKTDHIPSKFLKNLFHEFYLVHSLNTLSQMSVGLSMGGLIYRVLWYLLYILNYKTKEVSRKNMSQSEIV